MPTKYQRKSSNNIPSYRLRDIPPGEYFTFTTQTPITLYITTDKHQESISKHGRIHILCVQATTGKTTYFPIDCPVNKVNANITWELYQEKEDANNN